MTEIAEPKSIDDFSNDEIKEEYEVRFGAPEEPDDADLSDWTSADLIEELEERGTLPDAEVTPSDEIMDLIAEAAHTSPYAARAYELIRADDPEGLVTLTARQRLIAGRMGGIPL